MGAALRTHCAGMPTAWWPGCGRLVQAEKGGEVTVLVFLAVVTMPRRLITVTFSALGVEVTSSRNLSWLISSAGLVASINNMCFDLRRTAYVVVGESGEEGRNGRRLSRIARRHILSRPRSTSSGQALRDSIVLHDPPRTSVLGKGQSSLRDFFHSVLTHTL